MTSEKLYPARINFFVDEEKKLVAILAPGEPLPNVTPGFIYSQIKASGFGHAVIYEKAVAELAQYCSKAEQQIFIHIGEVSDSAFHLIISESKMEAYLIVDKPRGGALPDKQKILKAINEKGILFGLIPDAIDEAIQIMDSQERLIARGQLPQPGQDTIFTKLLPVKENPAAADTDEWGVVDYRDFGDLLSVEAGMPLIERTPATAGIPGRTVLGKEIPARPGQDIHFTPGLKGVEPDKTNPNRLLAKVSGQPIVMSNGICVEPILTLNNVDLSTGNVSFSGSLRVKGNVTSGMKVRAKKDIFIGGAVEAADIQTDGDVTVSGGVIGRGAKEKAKDGSEWKAFIRCNGKATLRFAENAHIEAGESIFIQDSALNSTLLCTEQIIVGNKGSSKGLVAGGICHAGSKIEVKVLGIATEVETHVLVGMDPAVFQRSESIRTLLKEKNLEKTDEQKRLIHYRRLDPAKTLEKIQEIEMTLAELENEIISLTQELREYRRKLESQSQGKIIVYHRIYSGVNIQMGSKKIRATESTRGGTFYFAEGDIVFSPQIMR